MIDISSVAEDIGLFDTQTTKAGNILSVQLGALEYAPLLGIDLKYFLSKDFKFQNASFRAYLVEVLANNAINVAGVVELINNLFTQYNFEITPSGSTGGLVSG
jgi:hypothetical protein